MGLVASGYTASLVDSALSALGVYGWWIVVGVISLRKIASGDTASLGDGALSVLGVDGIDIINKFIAHSKATPKHITNKVCNKPARSPEGAMIC